MGYKYINTEYLDSVSGGDSDIFREIVIMFREQIAEIYNEMKINLAEKNYRSLGLLAHKAKSSVAIMGMSDLAQMLKTLELHAKEGEKTELYDSFITRFKTETEEAVLELEDLVINRLNKK